MTLQFRLHQHRIKKHVHGTLLYKVTPTPNETQLPNVGCVWSSHGIS